MSKFLFKDLHKMITELKNQDNKKCDTPFEDETAKILDVFDILQKKWYLVQFII